MTERPAPSAPASAASELRASGDAAAPSAPSAPAASAPRPRSLSRRIFASVLGFTLAVMVVFSVALTSIYYVTYEQDAERLLIVQARDAAARLDAAPADERVAVLAEQFSGLVRYTLVAPDGEVLFDTAPAISGSADNHADRPEVRDAAAAGEAAVSRYSATLSSDTVYAAVRLADGAVLRLAETRESLLSFLGGLTVPVLGALAVAVLLVLLLSRALTRGILRPLDDLDVANPLAAPVYAEMAPLLERIDSQQRQLRQQNRALARAEGARRDFSANVSHEMKTPLQVIAGYAELIEGGVADGEDARQFAGIIHQESQAMRALIDDVLTLSRLDEVQPDAVSAAPVEVRSVAERAARRLDHLARQEGVAVSVEGDPAWIMGSEALMEQVVYNLIQNGIRYNEPGGSVTVAVATEAASAPAAPGAVAPTSAFAFAPGTAAPASAVGEGTSAAQVVIRVADTGPGVPEDKREKIFERFYRLEKSRSKETGGTGLGLAIVKHGVIRHGGSIEVGGREGEGAEFILRLPAVPAPSGTVAPPAAPPAAGGPAPGAPPAADPITNR